LNKEIANILREKEVLNVFKRMKL